MAIKDPLMFITIEEFKNWKGFNKALFDEVTTPDSEIRYAIEIASSNIDYLSGFTISKKWPEINQTKFTDNIQTATTHYVNFLLGKGVEYARGQASIGQGGITYSQNNPEDPYYIVPQVFNYLKEINEYPTMQGFNLNVSPKQNWFKKFMGTGGEQNLWEIYLQTLNLKSSDHRTKITITYPKNIIGSVVDIDTTGIKSLDNLTTLELFNKYFSNDTMKLVDGKEGQEKKVIGAIGGSGDSLWNNTSKDVNLKLAKNINLQGYNITKIADPIDKDDGTNKKYVDNLLDKKQNKLIAGTNITIDKETNTISTTGGGNVDENRIFNNKDDKDSTTRLVNDVIKVGDRTLIYKNNPSVTDDKDIPHKKYVDEQVKNKIDKDQFKYFFGINVIGTEFPNLETSNKTVAGAINENKTNIDKKQEKIDDLINKIFKDKKQKDDFVELLTNAFYLANTLFDENQFFGTNTKELGNKIHLNPKGIVPILKSQQIPELETYYKSIVDAINELNKKLPKIKSKTLNIDEVDNIYDIELKNNPTPSPSGSNWKEVGTKEKNKWDNWQITYDFQENKHYRVYYSWSIYNPVYTIQEFIITDKKIAGVQIQTFNDNVNIVILSVQHAKWITIYTGKGNLKGNLWKLEELQE